MMKKLMTLFVVGLTMMLGAGNAQALLTNGLLDNISVSSQALATPTDWVVDASRAISGVFNDGASSEGFANTEGAVGDCNGGGCGLFFKPFTGNATDGNVTVDFFQDNPASAGLIYNLSAWAGAGAGYVGLDPANTTTRSELAVEFLNGGTVIGGSVLDLKAAGLGTKGLPNAFGYAEFMVSSVAPGGTDTVRVRASMIDAFGGSGDQAFVVDQFTLTAVPEPSTVLLGGLALLGMVCGRRRVK